MKQILFLLLFAQVISAQTDCGSDIAPKESGGVYLFGHPCRFKAPGIDTCLTNIKDPKNKIEWVHQNGYSYYEIVDNNTGHVESSGYNPMSSTSAVGAFQETTRAPGEIILNWQRFYQYVPAGIKPDKNGTWDAGYGDAAPAFCGCLRRVEVKTETLYAGNAKALVSGSKSVSVTQNENGTVTIKANEWTTGKKSGAIVRPYACTN